MNLKLLLVAIYALVIALGVWQIVPAIKTHDRTGVLVVTSSLATAQLSISQNDRQAANIGTGSAKVRLYPGTYQVVASGSGNHTSAIVVVHAKQTTRSSLNLNNTNSGQQIHTVASITFNGMDSLLSAGLSTNQVNELEQYFFQFKPSANTVNINSDTVQSGSRDPNTLSPFTLNFAVGVDSAAYNATVSYMDLNNVKLQLFDTKTNVQVFTAGTVTSSAQ
jgi:hypothetical protein